MMLGMSTVYGAAIAAALAVTAAQESYEDRVDRPQSSVKVTVSSTTSGTSGREIFSQPQLLSDLLYSQVKLQNDDSAGEVTNLVIGPRGTIQYVVATHDGRNFLIPFRAMNFNPAERSVQLQLTPAQFGDVVFFEGRHLPDLTSVSFQRQMSDLFGVNDVHLARAAEARDRGFEAADAEAVSNAGAATHEQPVRTATATGIEVPASTNLTPNTVRGVTPRNPAPNPTGAATPILPGGPRVFVPGGVVRGRANVRPAVPGTTNRVPGAPPVVPNSRSSNTSGGAPIAPPRGISPNPSPGTGTPGGPPIAPPGNVTPNANPNVNPTNPPPPAAPTPK